MINIVVSQNGNVTGDKSKIIAYEGQQYSEIINITHPLFSGAKYYIEYKYDNTILRNELDSNNRVSIKINNAGYVKCQFIAIDLLSEDIIFKSKTWNLIVKEDLKIEVSHHPCDAFGHRYKHIKPIQIAPNANNNNFNAFEAYAKISHELSNEEDIRFNEIQELRQELAELKAFIDMEDTIASTLNANKIITPGKYNANVYSTGFPENNKEYNLNVSYYGDDNILQTAYEKKSNKVYYRSTLAVVSGEPEWNGWTLLTLQV
jgi:hypothetical protein